MLRIATLNVWFDDKLRMPRSKALIEVIKRMGVHVCCLQEVVPEVASVLASGLPSWSCSDPGDGSTVAPYGVMVLAAPGKDVRFSFHELPTEMCRQLLLAELDGLVVGTVHLESLANHPTREAQLRVCEALLAPFDDALLVGDFNFDSDRNFVPPHTPLENEALAEILPRYVDLWPALRSERGKTFDSSLNPYISRSEHMRYDRIMTCLSNWATRQIEIFGHEPVDHLVELSPGEKACAERPSTPPRPSSKKIRRSLHEIDSWDLDGDDEPSFSLPLAEPSHASGSHFGNARERTPSPLRSKFFLSDHFGLVATLEPCSCRDLGAA
mmetsp:Transcript_60151/g.105356  ORF Transcript_60151/g.105356 Transcript_60151/m.105356 type:complete len:326 (-) Transcript_60151:28-1005(-)